MKLRVKLQRQSQVIDLEQREPSVVSFAELKSVVSSRFGLENHDFQLSLNKNDALPSDEQVLSSVGIVSGDLLHIIGSNLPHVSPVRDESQHQPPLAAASSSSGVGSVEPNTAHSDASMVTVPSNSSGNVHRESDLGNDVTGQEGHDPDPGVEVNRFLLEPLVVRESTATQVPVLLEQLYLSATCNCVSDAVWVVVHSLMLEAGFLPQSNPDVTQIPAGWKQSGFYKCTYQLPFPGREPGECSVVGVPMASSLIVHGLARSESSFKTEHLQLKTQDFVRNLSQNVPSVYAALGRLSRQFKDTVCLPLQNELATAAGLPGGQGFTSLPYEIKLRILSSLDAVTLCHVAQTGADLGFLARDRSVWRRLYIRDYGKPQNSDLNRDWYEMYKDEFIRRREAEQRRRQFGLDQMDPFFGFPRGFRPFPTPDGRFPPHVIGGDYDLNPEFAAGGLPNPMGGGLGGRPGPNLPNVRIPDPLSIDPFGPGALGGRPGRGNLTGSPFSGAGAGRGGLFRSPFM